MTAKRLIETGVCEDLDEVLRMFPIETLADFRPRRRKPAEPEPRAGAKEEPQQRRR